MSAIKSDKAAKAKPARSKRSGPDSRLKVVVRRLPPNLPETVFWDSVAPWVDAQTASWKVFHSGKLRPKGVNKENVFSRAYIAFNTEEQLKNFHRDYDGHLFRDKSGNESQAVVEFAPYQKVPQLKHKVDQRQGTIQEDDDFKSFLASLNQVEPTEAEKLAMAPPPEISDKTTTPLLASLLPKETPADKLPDRRHDGRQDEKQASAKARRRKEKDQAQKQQREDDVVFSRDPISRAEAARLAEEQPKKGQTDKERPGNTKSQSRKNTESGDAPGKSKAKAVASPARPTRSKAPPQPGNDPASASASTSVAADSAVTSSPQKARPKFKFDGILVAGSPRPPKGGKGEANAAASAATSPTTETVPSDAPAPSSRKSRKGKERERDSAGPSKGGEKPAPDTGIPPSSPASPILPRILQRPVARIDDVETGPDASPQPGIISIQLPPRGRGRGGGRGRGRGRGRGGAPVPET